MVLTVLIHDGQALDAPVLRPAFGDVDDSGVEVSGFARDPLVDGVGDEMGQPSPPGGRRLIDETRHLLLGDDVPKPELDAQTSVRKRVRDAVDKGLGVDHAPVGETRQNVDGRFGPNECARIQRPKQPRALEIGRYHA